MSFKRGLKNLVNNYSLCERDVREATSNDPWGASGTLQARIATYTHDINQLPVLMEMIWKRMGDGARSWRHVYKSLTLLDYLCKSGSERVVNEVRRNIPTLEALKEFQFFDKDGKDQGLNVRERAKNLINLVNDEQRLADERERAANSKDRINSQNSLGGVSSSNLPPQQQQGRTPSYGDEQAQIELEVALAISREETTRQQAQRNREDDDLRRALELSKTEQSIWSPTAGPPVQADPWGIPDRPAPSMAWGSPSKPQQDPFSNPSTPAFDPFSPPKNDPFNAYGSSQHNDPFSSPAYPVTTSSPWGGTPPVNGNHDPFHAPPTVFTPPQQYTPSQPTTTAPKTTPTQSTTSQQNQGTFKTNSSEDFNPFLASLHESNPFTQIVMSPEPPSPAVKSPPKPAEDMSFNPFF